MKNKIQTLLAAAALVACGLFTEARAQNAGWWPALKDTVQNATNYDIVVGYEHSVTGVGKNLIHEDFVYNISDHAGLIVGLDQLTSRYGTLQNDVKGGFNLQDNIHPFSFIGSTALTNLNATVAVADLIATPKGNSSAIGNITDVSATFNILKFGKWYFAASIEGEKRIGQGNWDGYYAGGFLNLTKGVTFQPLLSDNRNANAWSTVAFANNP